MKDYLLIPEGTFIPSPRGDNKICRVKHTTEDGLVYEHPKLGTCSMRWDSMDRTIFKAIKHTLNYLTK